MAARSWAWVMYLQASLLQVGFVGARIMMGFGALAFTSDASQLGLFAATFALPAVVGALPAGRVLDRVGSGPIIVCGLAASIAACATGALAPGLLLLSLANLALGAGQVLCVIGQQGRVAERAGERRLDQAYGGLTSALSVGQFAGAIVVPALGQVGAASPIHPNTTGGLLASAGFLSLALGAAALTRAHRTAVTTAGPTIGKAARAVLATTGMWRALFVSGIVAAAVDLLYVFLPAWGVEKGVSALAVGWLLAARALVTVLSRFGVRQLIDSFGRRWLLVGCLSLGVVGYALLPFVGIVGGVVSMVFLGVALGLPQPLTISWVVLRTATSLRGSALGLRVTSNRLVQVVLPVTVGATAGGFGVAGSLLGHAALLLAAVAVSATAGKTLDAD